MIGAARSHRRWLAVTGLLAAASALLVESAGAADTQQCVDDGTTCPVITSVEVSRTSVSVSGTHFVPVTYTIGLRSRDTSGLSSGPVEGSAYSVPMLHLGWADTSKLGPPPIVVPVGLHQVSGTPMDGTWQATIYLPSTAAGVIVPNIVQFDDNDDPAETAANSIVPDAMRVQTTVNGVHQPKLSIDFHQTSPGSTTVVVTGRVLDSATGEPVPDVNVRLAKQGHECLAPLPSLRGVTDVHGAYSMSVPAAGGPPYPMYCVSIAGPRDSDGNHSGLLATWLPEFLKPVASLAPTTSTVIAGHSVTLSGTAWLASVPVSSSKYTPDYVAHVLLQRWTRHGWQTVDDGYTGARGRFTLVATPPVVGNWRYRAVLPGVSPFYWTGVSSSVTVRTR